MQKTIQFKSEKYLLSGTLHLPEIKNPPVVIGSHGLLSTGDSPKQIALAEECTKNNIAFFRYDHRGCGKSEGDFAAVSSFEGRCQDLRSAMRTMQDTPETGNLIGLFGSSYGGAISLAIAANYSFSSIVTVAAPLRSETIKPPYVNDPANSQRIQSLDKEKLSFDVSAQLTGLSNILIFHGDKDEIVPFANALELYKLTCSPKKMIQQKNGDHQVSNRMHQKEFIEQAINWFKEFFRSP